MAKRTRWKRIERRGRPPSATAKRRQTTRVGRAPEIDKGTRELRDHRRQVTGREDLVGDLGGLLLGRGLIDAEEHGVLLALIELRRVLARAFSTRVTNNWTALLAGARGGYMNGAVALPPATDRAIRILTWCRGDLPPLAWGAVEDAIDGIFPGELDVFAARLRWALDLIRRRFGLGH
jgi:hypothetical protein